MEVVVHFLQNKTLLQREINSTKFPNITCGKICKRSISCLIPEIQFYEEKQVEDMLAKVADIWCQPSGECPLEFLHPFFSSHKPFNSNWMLSETEKFLSNYKENEYKTKEFIGNPIS